jgi:hypothetical protein
MPAPSRDGRNPTKTRDQAATSKKNVALSKAELQADWQKKLKKDGPRIDRKIDQKDARRPWRYGPWHLEGVENLDRGPGQRRPAETSGQCLGTCDPVARHHRHDRVVETGEKGQVGGEIAHPTWPSTPPH